MTPRQGGSGLTARALTAHAAGQRLLELREQRACRTGVAGVVPLGEPPVHGRERRARLVAPPAVAEEPRPARGGAQLEGARVLPLRDLEGVPERSLGGRLIALEP